MNSETPTKKTYSVITGVYPIVIKANGICANSDGALELNDEEGDTIAAFASGVWKYVYLQTAVESQL